MRARRRSDRLGAPKGVGRKGRTSSQGVGRSRSGLKSRIVGVVDALEYLIRFAILAGRAHDLAGAPALLEALPFGASVEGRATDVDRLIEEVEGRGAVPVIPPKGNGAEFREQDREIYK